MATSFIDHEKYHYHVNHFVSVPDRESQDKVERHTTKWSHTRIYVPRGVPESVITFDITFMLKLVIFKYYHFVVWCHQTLKNKNRSRLTQKVNFFTILELTLLFKTWSVITT